MAAPKNETKQAAESIGDAAIAAFERADAVTELDAAEAEVLALKSDLAELKAKNAALERRAAAVGLEVRQTVEPEAPRIPLVVEGGVDFDVASMEAESTRRNLVYQETVALVRDQVQTGRFSGVPAALAERNFHFVRVGLKGDARAELKAQVLREKGYVPAPKGVRAIGKGYESDGERAIIYCASAQAHANLLRDKAVRTRARINRLHGKRQSEIEEKLRSSMPAGTDVHVALKIGSSTGGLNVLDGELAAAMRDLPRS